VAGVEDRSEPHAGFQWLDHDPVHLVVDNMSDIAEIDRVDDLVVPVLLVAIEILGLAAVAYVKSAVAGLAKTRRLTGVVEEERVVWSGVFH
jgi:hypothetical protein